MTRDADRFVRADDVLWRRLLDGVLVLAGAASEPVRIASPGDAVWYLLAQPVTVEEMVETIAELFDAPADAVAADVHRVLEVLIEHGAAIPHRASAPHDS